MNLKIVLLPLISVLSLNAMAQQSEKTALVTSAPVPDSVALLPAAVKPAAAVPFKQEVSYSLSAGAMGSSLGFASYVSPAAYYRVSPKFSAFTRLTIVNSSFSGFGAEKTMPMATRNYFVHVGGAYDVTEKLQLSGSVWRDFSGMASQSGFSNFQQPGRYGADFNALYKINDHVSLFGSIRTSRGNGLSPYNPYNSPMGFSPQFGY